MSLVDKISKYVVISALSCSLYGCVDNKIETSEIIYQDAIVSKVTDESKEYKPKHPLIGPPPEFVYYTNKNGNKDASTFPKIFLFGEKHIFIVTDEKLYNKMQINIDSRIIVKYRDVHEIKSISIKNYKFDYNKNLVDVLFEGYN